MSPEAVIEIGEGAGLSGTTIAAVNRVSIGPRSVIGADVLITDNDHHSLDATLRRRGESLPGRPIDIGADVFIGAKAVILKGTVIGDGAVIGAGAVVATTVPADHVAFGNPAQVRPLRQP